MWLWGLPAGMRWCPLSPPQTEATGVLGSGAASRASSHVPLSGSQVPQVLLKIKFKLFAQPCWSGPQPVSLSPAEDSPFPSGVAGPFSGAWHQLFGSCLRCSVREALACVGPYPSLHVAVGCTLSHEALPEWCLAPSKPSKMSHRCKRGLRLPGPGLLWPLLRLSSRHW